MIVEIYKTLVALVTAVVVICAMYIGVHLFNKFLIYIGWVNVVGPIIICLFLGLMIYLMYEAMK